MKLFARKHYLPWFRRKKNEAPKVDGVELVTGTKWFFIGRNGSRRNGIYTVTSISGGSAK